MYHVIHIHMVRCISLVRLRPIQLDKRVKEDSKNRDDSYINSFDALDN